MSIPLLNGSRQFLHLGHWHQSKQAKSAREMRPHSPSIPTADISMNMSCRREKLQIVFITSIIIVVYLLSYDPHSLSLCSLEDLQENMQLKEI